MVRLEGFRFNVNQRVSFERQNRTFYGEIVARWKDAGERPRYHVSVGHRGRFEVSERDLVSAPEGREG